MNIKINITHPASGWRAVMAMAGTVLLAVSLSAGAGGPKPTERMLAELNSILPDVTDQHCNFADSLSDPDTELYLVDFNVAVAVHFGFGVCDPETDIHQLIAPNGQPITLWDWTQARGRVTIRCEEDGTRYHFQFNGLVPDGVYTIWHFPGTGGGALASHPPDDINNVFIPNPAGNANFLVTGSPGPMTFGGAVSACTLPISENVGGGFENELFVILHHNDHLSHGGGPGPSDTAAAQLMFVVDIE